MAELARLVIYSGRDPFTPPQTKVVWVTSDIPFVKVPVVKYKYMNTEARLIVDGPSEEDVKKALEACLAEAVIRGLITGLVAAYASGGTAGVTGAVLGFVHALDSAVETKLKRELAINGEMSSDSSWDADYS